MTRVQLLAACACCSSATRIVVLSHSFRVVVHLGASSIFIGFAVIATLFPMLALPSFELEWSDVTFVFFQLYRLFDKPPNSSCNRLQSTSATVRTRDKEETCRCSVDCKSPTNAHLSVDSFIGSLSLSLSLSNTSRRANQLSAICRTRHLK
jgi:hypothetical protein